MGADRLGRGLPPLPIPPHPPSGRAASGAGLGEERGKLTAPGLIAHLGLSQRGTWPLLVGKEGGEPGAGL